MSGDGSLDRRKQPPPAPSTGNGNGVVPPILGQYSANRLRLNPNKDHKPDSYEDLQLEFSPFLFSSLEQYLPPSMLRVSRDIKLQYMKHILLRYSPEGERLRVRKKYKNLRVYTCMLFSYACRCFLFGCLENDRKEE